MFVCCTLHTSLLAKRLPCLRVKAVPKSVSSSRHNLESVTRGQRWLAGCDVSWNMAFTLWSEGGQPDKCTFPRSPRNNRAVCTTVCARLRLGVIFWWTVVFTLRSEGRQPDKCTLQRPTHRQQSHVHYSPCWPHTWLRPSVMCPGLWPLPSEGRQLDKCTLPRSPHR